ncbi:MAG: HlyD family secretion protein [Woeseiaceae bacterium]
MTDDTENNENASETTPTSEKAATDPVRKWTFIVLGACVFLMFWYLVSDRLTPYTTQARVHALVIPIAAEVSGTITDVFVANNQIVKTGDELFRIDAERYQLAVETAEADLQSARQATGASTANVDAARASVGSARANMVRSEKDAIRLRRIKEVDPGAISDRRLEGAEASLDVTREQLTAAQANLQKAISDLGQEGDDNSRILQAQTALGQARINLSRTTVIAPGDGVLSDVRLDRGNFAAAGAPQMTFIGVNNIWVQADFTENNLGNIDVGDPVEIVFDALPGQVVKGRVRSTGYGVDVTSAPLGSLPSVDNDRQWLRDAQRFPVLIDFTIDNSDDRSEIRVGAQASVTIYSEDGWLFNTAAKLYLRVVSLLTYAF